MGRFRPSSVRLVYFLRKSTEFHVKRTEFQRILLLAIAKRCPLSYSLHDHSRCPLSYLLHNHSPIAPHCSPPDEQKGVRVFHGDFNKQTYNRQTNSHEDPLCMSISNHINGLASTIEFKCNKKKQDKRLSNHHFPLHLPQQTKHHSCDPCYAALIC